VEVYQLHISLIEISPTIWRRLLVRSKTTIADLHYVLQIAFGWTDCHLYRLCRFLLHSIGLALPF